MKVRYFFITRTNNCYGYPKGTRVEVSVVRHLGKRIPCVFWSASGRLLARKLKPETLQKEEVAE